MTSLDKEYRKALKALETDKERAKRSEIPPPLLSALSSMRFSKSPPLSAPWLSRPIKLGEPWFIDSGHISIGRKKAIELLKSIDLTSGFLPRPGYITNLHYSRDGVRVTMENRGGKYFVEIIGR